MASLAIDDEKHTSRVAVEVLVQGASFGHPCPSRAQPLAVLDGLSLEDIEKLWPTMIVGGKGRSWTTTDQLHRAAVGSAEVFHLHAFCICRGSPRYGGRVRKQKPWFTRIGLVG